MNIVIIGSCLSASVVNSLTNVFFGFTFKAKLSHYRSDELLEIFEDSSQDSVLPDSEFYKVIDYLCKSAQVNNVPQLKRKISSHLESSIYQFREDLIGADAIVFDNNYDLAGSRFSFRIDEKKYRVATLNLSGITPEISNEGLLLSKIENLNTLYKKLFRQIRSISRASRIFFINYPIVGFQKRGFPSDVVRVDRSRIYSSPDFSVHPYCTYINKVDINEKDVSDKGPSYFSQHIYRKFAEVIGRELQLPRKRSDPENPYKSLPTTNFWKPAVAELFPLSISKVYTKKFSIEKDDALATCGSCFAQHIGKRLDNNGYNYLDLEIAPDDLKKSKAKELGYGIYSARYGNVYTSRQLLQLFQRAFGKLKFDEVWQGRNGQIVDPFRPNLCGEGYDTPVEVREAQQLHLQQVRKMFETLDILIFTMGLTETWVNRETGATYPICPGVSAGNFDPDLYELVNLDYTTILEEMELFIRALRAVNPKAKILLTVSPVPLTATAEDRHVLLSTMASKSILRAVADKLYREHDYVDYFPSYDIIMSPPFKGMFFKNNLRNIHEEGVDYIMSHFFAEHKSDNVSKENAAPSNRGLSNLISRVSEDDDEAFCDEAFLELERKSVNKP